MVFAFVPRIQNFLMNWLLSTLLLAVPTVLFAQESSFFDYSQLDAENILFIPSQRISFEEINIVDAYQNGETGGMHNTWNLEVLSFGSDFYQSAWWPLYHDSSYVFSWDSLVDEEYELNGFELYWDTNSHASSAGGYGYGSFDYSDYWPINDSVVLVETSCRGHCGSASTVTAHFNVYRNNRLVFAKIDLDSAFYSEENEPSYSVDSVLATTTENHIVSYSKNGLYIPKSIGEFTAESLINHYKASVYHHQKYYQVFIHQQPMKDWLLEHYGRNPLLVIFEIYRFGAVFFYFDCEKQQYVYSATEILE